MPLSTTIAAIMLAAIAVLEPESLPSRQEMDRLLGVPESDHSASTSSTPARPRKRPRTKPNEKKVAPVRTKGALKDLLDMPSEIFREIVCHLAPPDLLYLARSTKFFRSIFMSRTSLPLWESAIRNVSGLPECPSDMSAPHYISLIYSKTCSECGARVLRRMDPWLRVRLCGACRGTLVVEVPVFGLLGDLVPTSNEILPERDGEPHCLERDLLEAKEMIENHSDDADDDLTLERWKDGRRREIEQRCEHAADLDEFLDDMEEERANELQRLKDERLASIEERLHEDGWDTDDMVFPDETFTEWKQLVLQPKPLTDRIWINLYPKLVPLLRANRERNKRIEQTEKFHEREMVIHECMGVIQRAYPPLAKVSVYWDDRPDAEPVTTELDVPFPTTAEASRWDRIKTLVESDLDSDDVEDMFFERERNVGGRLGEWMRKIHDDVLFVWNGGGSGSQDAKQSKKEGGVRRSTRKSKAALDATYGTDLPRRTMVFTEPNGAVCTSPDELSDEIRLLLRADTVFRTPSGPCYYPDIIPSPVVKWVFTEFGEAPRFGDVWDRRKVEKDVETSDVARKMLDRMGNPDVSHPELGAMGKAFLCMRCKWDAPVGWLDFLKHYSTELSRWNEGFHNLSSRDDADEIVFNNTHDLDPSNTEPILKILDPNESAEMTRDRTKSLIPDASERDDEIGPMMCLMCDALGVEAAYGHRWTLDFEGSPMISHLRDVHGVQTGRYAVHYGRLWHATVTGGAGD